MTAAHVLRAAFDGQKSLGHLVGIVGRNSDGIMVGQLKQHDFAPNDQDVAVGLSAYRHKTKFRISKADCEVWQRVASCGYPEDAIAIEDSKIATPLRAFKGIIQRKILRGHLALQPKSMGYELSFSPSPGISGAPLFIYPGDNCEVVGVCVGSFRSEQVEDEFTEISDGGEKYSEKRVKIIQFGLAESLLDLFDWQPEFLDGLRLNDVAN